MTHAADYFADKSRVSWTTLKKLKDGPKAYRDAVDGPDEEKAIWVKYRVVHMGVFEPSRFGRDVAVYRDGKRDKRTKKYQEFMEAHPGAEILLPGEYDEARYMIDALMGHPRAWELLSSPGPSEFPVYWTDPVTGIKMKGLIDHHAWSNMVVDLKAATTADFHRMVKTISKYQYFGQVAGYKEASKSEEDSRIVFVQPARPWDVRIHWQTPEWHKLGMDLQRKYLDELKACQDSGNWPGKYPEEDKSDPPGWLYEDEADDLDYSDLDAE